MPGRDRQRGGRGPALLFRGPGPFPGVPGGPAPGRLSSRGAVFALTHPTPPVILQKDMPRRILHLV